MQVRNSPAQSKRKNTLFSRNDRPSKKALVIADRDSIPDYALFRQGSIERPAPLFKDSRRSYSNVVKTRFCPHAGRRRRVRRAVPPDGTPPPRDALPPDPEHVQLETRCLSNPAARRFAEKAFFRLLRAGRRSAAASRSAFYKGTMIYRQKNESLDTKER